MPTKADVVIIGGGVIGISIAYHLAKMGCRNVLLLEKGLLGEGSTGKCPGGIRQQFLSEINVRISMQSVEFFRSFEEATGVTADFRQCGYLILASTAEQLEVFRQGVAMQRRLGLDVSLLSSEEIKELMPQLNVTGVTGGTFCPSDGYADPYQVVQGFAGRARELGVSIRQNTEVTGLTIAGGKIKGVETADGPVQTETVINAAGPYAALVGRMAGVEIPVTPYRRHVFFTDTVSSINPFSPMVINFANGFWFRKEATHCLIGMRNPEEPSSFNTATDWGFLPTLGATACQRLPLLGDTGIVRGWAGLHSDTADCNPILGRIQGIDGLVLANGFSGHGFMHSPVVGRLVAEVALQGKATSLDISAFALDRFSGDPGRSREGMFI